VLPGTKNVTLAGTDPTPVVVGDTGLNVIETPSQVALNDDDAVNPVPVIVIDVPALPLLADTLIAGVTE
jgi:hypothetical protein